MNKNKLPFNILVMDVDRWVNTNIIRPVTSTMIRVPSTNKFSPEGLFSEEIFGQIGSSDRLIKHGYINLHTTVLAPVIYDAIISISSFYKDIMSGSVFVKFDDEKKDFVKVYDDPENDDDVDTGYSFFLKYFKDIEFTQTGSSQRSQFIDLINKYKDISLYDKCLVLPAGLRDISLDNGGMLVQDDINKLYITILSYANSIPDGTTSHIYDNVRFTLQCKLYDVYNYLKNFISGDTGFLEAHYSKRAIVGGTRNVISAAGFACKSTTDPQLLRPDAIKVGLYQTMKGCMPLIRYGINTYLLDQLSYKNPNITTLPLINKKTLTLENVDVTDETKRKYTSSDGVTSIINDFVNVELRNLPITIETESIQKSHYLMLVYDLGDTIYYFRSISDLELYFNKIDKSKIRPLTWVEALYVITYNVTRNVHVMSTRYPVLGDGSTVVSKLHLASTSPARTVELKNLLSPNDPGMIFPEYPIIGNAYMDTIVPSPYRIVPMGADYDGDTFSVIFILTEEGNQEAVKYLNSIKYIIDVQKNFTHVITPTMELAIHNLTMD